MEHLHILIVHNRYQLAGGEDTVAENEENLLKRYGHHVYHYYRENSEILKMNVFQRALAGLNSFFSIKTYKEIRKMIADYQIEIVHVHNTVPLVSCSVYYAAKASKCAIVQSIHNLRMICPSGTMVRNNKICKECLRKGLYCAIKHKCYRGSRAQSAILAVSIAFHRWIRTYKKVDAYLVTTKFNYELLNKVVPKEKIFLKPYYSDSQPRDRESKKREYYIFVSRLEYLKGIYIALEAFSHLPDQKLIVLGTGPEEDKARAYVEERKLSNIEFLGFKGKKEMLDLMYHAKALVFPTQWFEGFPMTIVESLAVGTPVIGSDIGNVGTIVRNHVNGLTFHYNSSRDLINKILFFEKNPEEARRMEEEAQNDFIKTQTPENVYERTTEIYNSIRK